MRYFVALFCFLSCAAFAQNFLPGTEDIPLMDGLKDVEETASFDSPTERMVLLSAETTLSAKQIFGFYQQTLTNLGWQQKKEGYFERGTDSFLIEIAPNGKKNQIQFKLSQSNA